MIAVVQDFNQCWLRRSHQCSSLPLFPVGQFFANRSWTRGPSLGSVYGGFLASSYRRLLYPVSCSARWADSTVLTSHCVHWAHPPVNRSWRFLVRSPCGAGGKRADTGGGGGGGAAGMQAPPPPSALLRLDEALLLLAHRLHLCIGWVARAPAKLHGWPPAWASLQGWAGFRIKVRDHSVIERLGLILNQSMKITPCLLE